MKATSKVGNRKYKSILSTSQHVPVTSMAFFKNRWSQHTMGFYAVSKNGGEKAIGTGDLVRFGPKDVSTTSVSLFRGSRRKGHGIPLYNHLIESARKLGARRICSDTSLNKFSRRMWREKLAKIYNVKIQLTRKPCSYCQSKHRRELYYYIELT